MHIAIQASAWAMVIANDDILVQCRSTLVKCSSLFLEKRAPYQPAKSTVEPVFWQPPPGEKVYPPPKTNMTIEDHHFQ